MPTHNSDVVEALEEIADLLELKNANPFRVRAYREAARTVGSLSRRLDEMLAEGEDLSELSGIGKDLAGKIETLVEEGDLPLRKRLRKEVSPGLLEVLEVPTLGPKRTRRLAEALDIEDRDDLLDAAERHRIREVKGFGQKTESTIREEAERQEQQPERYRHADAEEAVGPLVEYLRSQRGAGEVVVAGSYRRWRQTVGDIDILLTSNANRRIMDAFVAYEDVADVLSQGSTRSSVRLARGLQVDLRVVPKKSYGAALLYFTGSKAHNIRLRKRAQARGLKINEYGIFDGETQKAGQTEAQMYDVIGLPWFDPELREDRGEIEAAEEEALPALVQLDEIRGDLHSHSDASDGNATLEEMAEAARARGYAYLAVTDHSAHVGITRGLDADAMEKRIETIRQLDGKYDAFRVLAGVEVDIREDGSLALPDSLLAELDVVIASVHTAFGLSRQKQTRRILAAMEHESVHALGHPTGRLLGKREGYEVEMEEILGAAADGGWHLELNANPLRLDLDDVDCKRAKEKGVRLLLGTDAHHVSELDQMRHGIGQARRGWLERDDVLNTRAWNELKALLQRGS